MKNQEKPMNTTVTQKRPEWLIPAGLLVLSLVPAIAGTVRLVELSSNAEITAANARFFASPLPVVLHIISVTLYSLLGAFQFAPGFRRRHRGWHRMAGRLLIPSGLVAALSGLWMSHFYPWPAGDGVILYGLRLFFGAAMLFSILFGIGALWRRDYVDHGAWMVRLCHWSGRWHPSADPSALGTFLGCAGRIDQSAAYGCGLGDQPGRGRVDHPPATGAITKS
jgi:hypothetical protein